MRAGEICNREVVVIDAGSSIVEAAKVMREYHVGDVIVVSEKYGKQSPIGILTDRDIALEIVAQGTDPEAVRVGDAMSFELVTADENDDLMHVIETMRDRGVRRIPVIDADQTLVGILTVDDVLDLVSEIFVDIVHLVDRQNRHESRVRP